MTKTLIAPILAAFILIGTSACISNQGQKETNTPDESVAVEESPDIQATFTSVFKWKNEDLGKYYETFLVWSEDFYDLINENDIVYLTDEYVAFQEAFPDANINVYNIDQDNNEETFAYVTIETNTLFDTKKLFAEFEGQVVYIKNANTQAEYIELGGKEENWISFILQSDTASANVSFERAIDSNRSFGVLASNTEHNGLYFYKIVNDQAHDLSLEISQLSSVSIDDLITSFKNGLMIVKNGEEVAINANDIKCSKEDNKIHIDILIDKTDIDAVLYNQGGATYFPI